MKLFKSIAVFGLALLLQNCTLFFKAVGEDMGADHATVVDRHQTTMDVYDYYGYPTKTTDTIVDGKQVKTVYYSSESLSVTWKSAPPEFVYEKGETKVAFEENWLKKNHFLAYQFLDGNTIAFTSKGIDLNKKQKAGKRGRKIGLFFDIYTSLGVVAMVVLDSFF